MNEIKKSKVERFVKDEMMVTSVYEVIRDSFLKNKGSRDIQIMAAERIAIDLLNEAWKELAKYKSEDDRVASIGHQIGL